MNMVKENNSLEKWCVENNPELLKEWHTISRVDHHVIMKFENRNK